METNLYFKKGIFEDIPNTDRYSLFIPRDKRELDILLSSSGVTVPDSYIFTAGLYDSQNGNVPILLLFLLKDSSCVDEKETLWTDMTDAVPSEVKEMFKDYILTKIK